MKRWQRKLELYDIWTNDEIPALPESGWSGANKRDLIVERIKKLPHYVEDCQHERFDEDLWWIVDELSDAQDEDHFDLVWGAFYDWADAHSVWVNVHTEAEWVQR